jgi:ribosomal protein S12 methylthiotransferase accessory factor
VIDSAAFQVAARIRERLDISMVEYVLQDWPLQSVSAIAAATREAEAAILKGYGGGGSGEAGVIAVMEYVERYAQFRCDCPPPEAVVPWETIRDYALSPLSLGLYDSTQYAVPDFPCRPFDPTQPLEWIGVTDLLDGTLRCVPCEFIYPHATLGRSQLVCETSSGTAAHVDHSSAVLAALCELVEHDAAMLFWYRQPPTLSLSVEEIGVPSVANDLEHLRRLGYVVIVANLDYDLGIPCFLLIAMQGGRFAHGLGCHPSTHEALLHAMTELCCGLAWLSLETVIQSVWRSFAQVHLSGEHYELYNGGSRYQILRQVLARTLVSGGIDQLQIGCPDSAFAPAEALAFAIEALAKRGFRGYACEITPGLLRDSGIHVVRVLVPGLVPFHFGFDRLRLGCERLWNTVAPGKLRQLLPHFLH